MSNQSNPSKEEIVYEDWMTIYDNEVALTGEYPNKTQIEQVMQSVSFWKTIKKYRQEDRLEEIEETLRVYASCEDGDGDPSMAVIARMELLPTPIFRRMLWFYNIDFQSFESCLRRLTEEQIQAINETFLAFQENTVPTCMREGVWNRIRQLVVICSDESKTEADKETYIDTKERYQTKSALSYNFFGWDMGFCTYQQENSDDRVLDNVARQFLKRKSHENDFTVNQEEGGIYWFLYRYARANYLWGDPSNVQLKTSVCPGFYMTLIYWFFIILGSPMLLALAYLKFTGLEILKFINQFVDEKIKVDVKFWKTLSFVLLDIGGSGGLIFAISIAGEWLYHFSGNNAWYVCSVITFSVLYVVYMGHYKKWIWPHKLPWAGKPLLGYILFQTVYDNREILFYFLKLSAFNLISWVSENSLIFSYLLVNLIAYVLVGINWFRLQETDKYLSTGDDIWYKNLGNRYRKILILFILMLLITPLSAFVVFNVDFLSVNLYDISTLICVVLLIGLTFPALLYLPFIGFEPKLVRTKRMVRKLDLSYRDSDSALINNRWLKSLSDLECKVAIDKIVIFAERWMYQDEINHFLQEIDGHGYKLLKQYDDYFKKNQGRNRNKLYPYLLRGVKIETALAEIAKSEIPKKKWPIFLWLSAHFMWLSALYMKIRYGFQKGINDLKTMKKIMDEHCPYISKPKSIE